MTSAQAVPSLLLLFAALTPLPVPGQAPAAQARTGAQPRLVLEDPSWDFGRIDPGAVLEHRFRLRNAGDAPLALGEPRPSCGCTSARIAQRLLAPGESTELQATFHAYPVRGSYQISIGIPSNDPAAPSQSVSFRSEILPGVEASPQEVSMAGLEAGERRTASVKLHIATGQPVRLQGLERPEAPWLEVATREEGGNLWLDLTLDAGKLPVSRLSGTDLLRLRMADLKPAEIPIRVSWQRIPPVDAEPSMVFWEQPADGRRLSANVVLRHPRNRPFRILAVRTSNPLVTVTGVDRRASARKVIGVHLAPSSRIDTYEEKAYLTLDTPGHPELELLVVATLTDQPGSTSRSRRTLAIRSRSAAAFSNSIFPAQARICPSSLATSLLNSRSSM